MGEHKFTPGPWEAIRDPVPPASERWAVYADGAPSGYRLPAECVGPEAKANAQLIAAAPDLYDALKWALKYGTFDVATDNPLHGRALDHARDALAKAEGRGGKR